jgi:NAD(P)-dependent dehydrogenase (short-subunit alcohol dehydrogenase family)
VTDEAQVAAAVDLVVELHGRFDMMLRNARVSGCLAPGLVEALDLVDFDRVMAINARVTVAGVKHATRVMVPRRAGSIVCMASVAGVLAASRCRPIACLRPSF